MTVMDMTALHFSDELPQAPLNTPVNHQKLGAHHMSASHFIDAILEAQTSNRSGTAFGDRTLPPSPPKWQAPSNTPVNHQKLDTHHINISRFIDAVLEAQTSNRSGTAFGDRTLPPSPPQWQAPSNTPVNHQKLDAYHMNISCFIDAVLEAETSGRSEVAIGDATLVPPN